MEENAFTQKVYATPKIDVIMTELGWQKPLEEVPIFVKENTNYNKDILFTSFSSSTLPSSSSRNNVVETFDDPSLFSPFNIFSISSLDGGDHNCGGPFISVPVSESDNDVNDKAASAWTT